MSRRYDFALQNRATSSHSFQLMLAQIKERSKMPLFREEIYISRSALKSRSAIIWFFGTVTVAITPAPSDADPITVGAAYLIDDQRGPNDLGFATGSRISYGDTYVVPNGGSGTTGSAVTTNISTGATVSLALPFIGSPAIPDQFGRSIAYSSSLLSPYTLTFTNGTNSASVTTGSLVGVTPAPFATNVTYSGSSTNPTFSWNYAPGSVNGVFFDIYDKSLISPTDSGLAFYKVIPGTSGTYTVPNTLAGGLTLETGHQYVLDLYGVVSRDPTQPLSNANSAAWSEAFFDFTPEPAGGPTVSLPTIDADGVYHYSLSITSPDTFYDVDPTIVSGYTYQTGTGDPNFEAVILPALQTDPYTVSFMEGGVLISDLVAPDTEFDFPAGGVSEFSVSGIEASDGIMPGDTNFTTGLAFEAIGTFTGTQTPITEATAVAEPPGLAIMAFGLLGLVYSVRRRQIARE